MNPQSPFKNAANRRAFPSGDAPGMSIREYLIGQALANPAIVELCRNSGVSRDAMAICMAERAIQIADAVCVALQFSVEQKQK